jgi:hypothetical protein
MNKNPSDQRDDYGYNSEQDSAHDIDIPAAWSRTQKRSNEANQCRND